MKFFHTFVFLILVTPLFSFGQSCFQENPPENEIGTQLFSIRNARSLAGFDVPEKKIHFAFLNGIHYKRYIFSNAIRVSAAYTQYKVEPDGNCTDCMQMDGLVRGGFGKVGYERFFVIGRLEPYIGADLMVQIGTYKGERSGVGDSGDFELYEITTNSRGIGISPVVGLRFFLTGSLSLGAETSFDILYYNSSEHSTQITPTPSSSSDQSAYAKYEYQPLSWLSINVLF